MRNYYDILNSESTATYEELKKNYKQLILQCHPDKIQQQQRCHQQLASRLVKEKEEAEDAIHKQKEERTVKVTVKASTINAASKAGNNDGHHCNCSAIAVDVDDDMDFFVAAASAATATADLTDPNAEIDRKFIAIHEAWDTLKDPIKRKHYDAELLQTKFEKHNNIYDTITLNDMRHTTANTMNAVNDDDDDDDDDFNTNCECVGGAAGVESKDNGSSADDDVGADEYCNVVYYVYDCRCGGQYALDESAVNKLRSSRNRRGNGNREQPQRQFTAQSSKADVERTHTGAGENENEGDDEVLVECNECSLVIIVKPQSK